MKSKGTGDKCPLIDELLFPYGASAGDPTNTDKYYVWGGICANGAAGIAKLRRDGFASVRSPGTLTTEKLRFSGGHLFVNAKGSLLAEVLDEDGNPIDGLTLADCSAFTGDSTRFHLTESDVYAFWISSDERGCSRGYVAGGGPEFRGGRD